MGTHLYYWRCATTISQNGEDAVDRSSMSRPLLPGVYEGCVDRPPFSAILAPMKRMRSRFGSLALWLMAGGLLVCLLAAVIWFDNELNRGIAYGLPERYVLHADVPQGGVNAYFLHLEPDRAAVIRTFELIADAGIRFVRVQFPWEDIEIHGKGDFEDRRHQPHRSAWEKYDFIVDQARAHGLELIVRLDRPPEWARAQALQLPTLQERLKDDPAATGPPDRFEDYGDFVAAVVSRYKGRVTYYQLWNEPNLRNEWNYDDPDPARFVQLLRIGYLRAKQADPSAIILGPSLSPSDGKDWRAISDLAYLDGLYRAGGAEYFDIMSVQLYGLGQPPDEHRYVRPWQPDKPLKDLLDRPLDTRADVSRVVLIREIMDRHGDEETAVWVSEFGWNTAPFSTTWGAPVSEEQKAQYIVGLMERARREWPWMGVMCVWFLRYGGAGEPNPADPTPYFALVTRGWQPLPAYVALRNYLRSEQVLGPGVYRLTAGQGGHIPRRQLHFWGTTVALELPAASSVSISVDGGAAQTIESGASPGRVIVAEGLPLGRHTLTIHNAPDALDVVIGREQQMAWIWWLAPSVLLALLALVCARILWLIFTLPGTGRSLGAHEAVR